MSAYIVDRQHIVYLVSAAMSRRILGRQSSAFRWFHIGGAQSGEWQELQPRDYERAAEVGNMLLRENIASVSARYPRESSATLPGPAEPYTITPDAVRSIGAQFEQYTGFEPAQVFKSIDCYAYQACEHDTWEQSESYAFIQALRGAAWHALVGYQDAAWGAPEIKSNRRAA